MKDYLESLKDKNMIITEGKEILNSGRFPDEVLERISDSRLREDVSKKVFLQEKVRFQDLTKEEKQYRRLRYAVKTAFEDYLQGVLIFKNISYLLIIMGAITWFSAFVGANNNTDHGVLTLAIGAVLFVVSLKLANIKKFNKHVLIFYSLITVIEYSVLGMPDNYLLVITQLGVQVRGSIILHVLNVISPYVYMGIRVMIIWLLYTVCKNYKKFIEVKGQFEKMAVKI